MLRLVALSTGSAEGNGKRGALTCKEGLGCQSKTAGHCCQVGECWNGSGLWNTTVTATGDTVRTFTRAVPALAPAAKIKSLTLSSGSSSGETASPLPGAPSPEVQAQGVSQQTIVAPQLTLLRARSVSHAVHALSSLRLRTNL